MSVYKGWRIESRVKIGDGWTPWFPVYKHVGNQIAVFTTQREAVAEMWNAGMQSDSHNQYRAARVEVTVVGEYERNKTKGGA